MDRKTLKLHFTVLHFTKKTRKPITRAKKRPVVLRRYCIMCLYSVLCTVYSVYRKLYITLHKVIFRMSYIVPCRFYSVHIVQFGLCNLQYKEYNIHYTIHTIGLQVHCARCKNIPGIMLT